MARLQPRRLCRNFIFVVLLVSLYIWFSSKDDEYLDPIQAIDYSENDAKQSGTLFVDDFWVPQKGFVKASGPGEGGKPVTTSSHEQEERAKAYQLYGFNQFTSDKISLNRTVPETRPAGCKLRRYPKKLLKASVVIIFHNEGWSTLIRTVHSVLNRSPPSMLKEIVMVDDFSNKVYTGIPAQIMEGELDRKLTKPETMFAQLAKFEEGRDRLELTRLTYAHHLKEKLENYIVTLGKVRLIRAKERLGLIRARMLGASNVLGDVVIVLDSHCEVNKGWLPPLLEPITRDEHVVTCPIIDFIDHDSFTYKPMGSFMRGTFNWRFDYKERALTEEQMAKRKDATQEVWSPVMAGGLFAISKNFFDKLGQYDPGMEVWGGEQYELSFKIWMCGGKMANMPCSRVGHVYRKNVPYSYPKPNAVSINFRRVAEVWMDDYKEWLYERRPELKEVKDFGDISDRVALRKKLKCRTFQWYMQNVAKDTVRQNYEPLRGAGMVRNPNTNLCLDTMGRGPGQEMGLSTCRSFMRTQKFQYSYIHEIRNVEDCIDGPNSEPGSKVYLYRCHEMHGNQEFHYTKEKTIHHTISGLCVSVGPSGTRDSPILDTCNGKPEQIWEFKLTKVKN